MGGRALPSTQTKLTKKADITLMKLQVEMKDKTEKKISKPILISMILDKMSLSEIKKYLEKEGADEGIEGK